VRSVKKIAGGAPRVTRALKIHSAHEWIQR
jgi:hypothetical protein